MKHCQVAGVLALAAVWAGCASKPVESHYHAGDENPPDFMVGPINTVLTNIGGFSAHVVATVSTPDGPSKIGDGEILEREGRLIYQPALAEKKKKTLSKGSLMFIWDEGKHSGCVVSDGLQGYAPVKAALNVNYRPLEGLTPGTNEVIGGHPCERLDGVVPLEGGPKVQVSQWRASDLNQFPLRIQCSNGEGTMTLEFSQVRLTQPPSELFEPPDGFRRYPTAGILMNELLVREAGYRKGLSSSTADEHSGNWHDMQTNPK